MTKTSIAQLRHLADCMIAVHRSPGLAAAAGIDLRLLERLADTPAYTVFNIAKRDGSARVIENPAPALKTVQRRLNDLFQAVYYFERPEAAYGFVVNPADDPAPRHIVTHAERHLDCRWLLNIDLEDFFHQVDTARVAAALQEPPFQMTASTADIVTKLCTWNGRLPMGAPTSPVLSNIAFRGCDRALMRRSRERGWLYTRYADDLTFSSDQNPMTEADLTETIGFIEQELGYTVHPRKRRFCGEGDLKSVTRLVLHRGQVMLPEDFYAELEETLGDLNSARRAQHKMGTRHTRWLSEYEQRVGGMLAFAQHVLGKNDPKYADLLRRFQQATSPAPEDFGTYSWLDFPYF